MIDYRSPAGDILFALQYGAGAPHLPAWDGGLAQAPLEKAARLVDGVVAPLDPLGDAQPARLEFGRVHLPPQFAAAYRAFCAGGWPGLAAPAADALAARPEPHSFNCRGCLLSPPPGSG